MLSLALIAPGHQMFIPDISGEAIKDMEVSVNGLLKLALKLSVIKPEVLIIITPGLPVYHHRIGMSHAAHVIRVFESNARGGEIVELQFPGADSTMEAIEKSILENKISVEHITHKASAVAIDNKSLALLYYLQKAGCTPEVLFVSTSDLSPQKHMTIGQCIGEFAKNSEKNIAVAAVGCVSLMLEDVSSVMQEGLEKGDFEQALRGVSEEKYLESGQQMYLPLLMLEAVCTSAELPQNYHFLGKEVIGKEAYCSGYFD